MRPYPADLKETAPQRTAAEIFYVIKNGIKMTGMPSFGSTGVPDDEMWKIAAFVKKIPTTTDADYKAWTARAVVIRAVHGLKNDALTLSPGLRPIRAASPPLSSSTPITGWPDGIAVSFKGSALAAMRATVPSWVMKIMSSGM